jgi:hypothetical protein
MKGFELFFVILVATSLVIVVVIGLLLLYKGRDDRDKVYVEPEPTIAFEDRKGRGAVLRDFENEEKNLQDFRSPSIETIETGPPSWAEIDVDLESVAEEDKTYVA